MREFYQTSIQPATSYLYYLCDFLAPQANYKLLVSSTVTPIFLWLTDSQHCCQSNEVQKHRYSLGSKWDYDTET